MTEATVGREPIQIVEFEQPFCANTFGLSPCTAVASSPDRKCYNTRSTCGDGANFTLGDPLILRFAKGTVADGAVLDAGYVIPCLVSVSTSPTKINLASSNPDATGLGNRALCSLVFQDFQHTDRLVDPYLSDRTWDPLSPDRGSFWTRWLARNKYRQNILIRVYEGYAGQQLSEMLTRTYFLQEVSGPDASGRITIKGKDILAKLEERKAQAPIASPGVLYTDIDETATSFEVAGATTDDYTVFGTVRVGDEVMRYTGRAASENGITLSGITRGTDGTTAQAHAADDGVQQCLRYVDASVNEVMRSLLNGFGGIPLTYLALLQWLGEVNDYLGLYQVNTLITDPTSVAELVSELQVSAKFNVWWDERDAKVKLRAVRGVDAEPPTITDERHIIAGTFALKEMPRERASQVWIYYGQKNPTEGLEDPANYQAVFIIADLDSETDEKYGEPSIRKIYSRWLNSAALAQTTATSILTRYVDVPSQAVFRLDAKDRQNWVGDNFYISHYNDVDQFGARRLRQWTVVSAEEVVPGEVVEYVCEDTTLYGRIFKILADGAADYPGTSAAFNAAYIGNANGLLGDGTEAARIA